MSGNRSKFGVANPLGLAFGDDDQPPPSNSGSGAQDRVPTPIKIKVELPPLSSTRGPVANPLSNIVPDPMAAVTGVPSAQTTDKFQIELEGAKPMSIPSPLASPVLSAAEPPRQDSFTLENNILSAAVERGTSPTDMLLEEIFNTDNCDEPPTARRKAEPTMHDTNSTSIPPSVSSDNVTSEHLQPVKFEPGTGRIRKLSNASLTRKLSNASSFQRVGSSTSLNSYSEYSLDSGGPLGSSPSVVSHTKLPSANSSPHGEDESAAQTLPGETKDRRHKRLERNRESARASRRRRKQYLEDLDARVMQMGIDMDKGRIAHACSASKIVRAMRLGKVNEIEKKMPLRTAPIGNRKSGISHNVTTTRVVPPSAPRSGLDDNANTLLTALSRANPELHIAQVFLKQQLMSVLQSSGSKFFLWASLQHEEFYRGGRSQSERLSAARIGERLLQKGTRKATPSEGMWPLVCHEIGLSYDQEDKIRQAQRRVLTNKQTWVDRHLAFATQSVVNSIHSSLGGAQVAAKKNETSLMNILTPEQRMKFFVWANKKNRDVKRVAGRAIKLEQNERKTSPALHAAANLYVINHQLATIVQPPLGSRTYVRPQILKKFSRRPVFESLMGSQSESEGNSKLSREKSFPSTGSLKRSLNEVIESSAKLTPAQPQAIQPQHAHALAQSEVMSALKDVLPIVPESAHRLATSPPTQPPPVCGLRPDPVVSSARGVDPVASENSMIPEPVTSTSAPCSSFKGHCHTHTPITDDDIPMPTPISVLMTTNDDFMMEPLQETEIQEQELPPPNSQSFLPDVVSSSEARPLGIARSHHSAPQLGLGGVVFDPDFSFAPMGSIPEGSSQNESQELEELQLEADDWAIGESFDVETDTNQLLT